MAGSFLMQGFIRTIGRLMARTPKTALLNLLKTGSETLPEFTQSQRMSQISLPSVARVAAPPTSVDRSGWIGMQSLKIRSNYRRSSATPAAPIPPRKVALSASTLPKPPTPASKMAKFKSRYGQIRGWGKRCWIKSPVVTVDCDIHPQSSSAQLYPSA